MKYCIKKANQHQIDNYRHAACVVKGGRLVNVGVNTNKKGRLIDPLYEEKGCHAELMALCSLSEEQVRGSVLYVAGWSKGNNIVNSKPCPICQQYIKKFDLKAVYYSLPNGEYEELII
ncbi:hypothetical protein KP014_19975 [Paenibacillus sophorae]|uniref:CMP/dCMP-type deaminase domain-containing protein n=1 Tax=Paenibacillus sophorae TaxID=1333845 RepID=A0ABX8HKF6_9BACL|nr:hypothetical protein KP014_19975 [Paenibacillus sophorae]